MDILQTIITASFILVVGLFGGLIGYFPKFSDKVGQYLKKEEDTFLEDFSKAIAEPLVNLIKINQNIQPDLQQLSGFYKKIFEKEFQIIERREIIREPYHWLNDLKRGICLAILLFLASGALGLSYYDTYAPFVFVFGLTCVVYGVYKFYQITNRTH